MQRLDPDRFFLIVIDEAHHATAETYRRVLDYFGVFVPGTRKLLVGFTATPERGDGLGLDAVFEEIVFSKSLPEMIKTGFLSPVAGYRVETEIDLFDLEIPWELATYAEYAWARLVKGGYRLGLKAGSAIVAASTILGRREVKFRQRGREKIMISKKDLRSAVLAAEDYVKNQFPDLLPLVRLPTPWRRAPATEKQIRVLRRRKIEPPYLNQRIRRAQDPLSSPV